MSDPTYTTKVYEKQGGAEVVVASGGQITVESGGKIVVQSGGVLEIDTGGALDENNVDLTAVVVGVAGGYKIARGSASITGATLGDIVTGLATVVSVTATLGEDSTLAGNHVTAAIGGTAGHITLKVWKPTASGDCTPILSTAAKVVNWEATGT